MIKYRYHYHPQSLPHHLIHLRHGFRLLQAQSIFCFLSSMLIFTQFSLSFSLHYFLRIQGRFYPTLSLRQLSHKECFHFCFSSFVSLYLLLLYYH